MASKLPKPLPVPVATGPDPAAQEEQQVHAVYEAIAPHFARTRFKPWPLIDAFLASLPACALGLDAGAGNGKYLPSIARAGAYGIELDRSQGLLEIAKGQLDGGAECVRGDIADVPWRADVFDFAISVAAIHHLTTPERRSQSVKALLRPLRDPPSPSPPSRFFIYVWAYEQGPASRRKMGSLADAAAASTTSEADGESRVQDVLVPWVLAAQAPKTSKAKGKGGKSSGLSPAPQDAEQSTPAPPADEAEVFHRYYHLFVRGELRALVEGAAAEEGYAVRPGAACGSDPNGAIEGAAGASASSAEEDGVPPGHRWLRIVGEGWEADNWWVEGEVGCA